MKKITSLFLTGCILATSAVCTGITASATETETQETAKITVYDYCGAAFDSTQSTHSYLSGKRVNRGTYEFEVGDIVNVTVSYTSSSQSAISAVIGSTFINQKYQSLTNKLSFDESTNGKCDMLSLTDWYHTRTLDTDGSALYDPYTYLIGNVSGALVSSNPLDSNPNNTESDFTRDRISYTAATASTSGFKISSLKKFFTFTVRVEEPGEAFLYTVTEDAIEPTNLSSVTENLRSVTAVKKVGHEAPLAEDECAIKVYYDNDPRYRRYVKTDGTVATFEAKEIEGKYFSYWSSNAEGTDVLSTNSKYVFKINKSTSIYAIYADNESDVMAKVPTLTMTGAYAKAEDDANNIYFEATRSVPDGYTLKSHGIIYGRNKSTFSENPEETLQLGLTNVKTYTNTTKSKNATDVMSYNMGVNKSGILWARGYMVVINTTTNQEETIYSDVVSGSFNTLPQK